MLSRNSIEHGEDHGFESAWKVFQFSFFYFEL